MTVDPAAATPHEGPHASANSARPSSLLASLFPLEAATAELRESANDACLFPEEQACVQRAISKRRQEFTAGRLCARQAASRFVAAAFPLLPNEDRSPRWPDALTGSITHTRGFAGAVVGQRSQFRGLGLDAEVIGRVGEALWPQICTPAEIAWLRGLPSSHQNEAATLIFAAKEAFYKCQHSVTKEWLDFQAASVERVEANAGPSAFLIRPMKPMKLLAHAEMPLRGYFTIDDGLLLAGIALRAA